jgi:hypothetical protein
MKKLKTTVNDEAKAPQEDVLQEKLDAYKAVKAKPLLANEMKWTEPINIFFTDYDNPYKKTRFVDQDNEPEDHIEEYISKRSDKRDNEDILIYYNRYNQTKSSLDLFKFLVKAVAIHMNSSSICFNPLQNAPNERNNKLLKDRIHREKEQIQYDLHSYYNIELSMQDYEILDYLLAELYNTPLIKLTEYYMGYKEDFMILVEECSKRHIELNDEIKAVKDIDFKEFRQEGNCLKILFAPQYKMLILGNKLGCPYGGFNLNQSFLDTLRKLPVYESLPKLKTENITLNNIEYPKSLFESLVECSLDKFINNLNLEKFMEEKSNVISEEQLKML